MKPPRELRSQLLGELVRTRRLTDALFDLLTPDAFFVRPVAERHRLVFYLGHLEVFDWNLLCRDALGRPSVNPEWEALFAFGIDPVGGDLPTDRAEDWPTVEAVRAFGRNLRRDVDQAMEDAPLEGWLASGWALRLAIEHRLMHVETLAYLLHRLPPSMKRGENPAEEHRRAAPPMQWVDVPAGVAVLGAPRGTHGHAVWDNELERHELFVPAFRIQKHSVTNVEYLRFVEDGGYTRRELWTPDDWAYRVAADLEHPAFWRREGGEWRWRAMFGDIRLPPAWPVWVSLAEARAWARWAGKRLPTEAEWQRAAYGTPTGALRAHPWGDEAPVPDLHGVFGHRRFDPSAVDAHPAGASAFGVHGLVGNGWQWTATPFGPLPGFEPLPFYAGYSERFFDGKHFVLKGAGPYTDTTLLRSSFRNWFQPHYPHIHAAFRCAEDA